MRWTVELAESAVHELVDLPAGPRERIQRRIGDLAEDPFPQGVKKLKGYWNLHRLRVGDYRVLYQVRPAQSQVRVLRIRHRRDAYRGL